ncbi:hypothetical protein EMCRGX_G013949 [Ephydatia muelleri]
MVGVVLGFALSQLVNHLSLRATVRRTQPTEDAAKAASGDIAFTNLRRDGAAAYYDAEGYHLDDDALRETPVASLHPSKDQEVTWGEYARILAQRKEAIVLTRAVGPWLQRHVLLTAIVTSAKRIASGHTLALHGTWGVDASHLVYFAERDVPAALPAGMDLVQMDLLDSEAAWEEKELAVVRHLGALYCDRSIEEDRFDWFLVATDEVYVASHVLENRLNQLDANLPTCLGVFGGAERNARFFGGAVVYSKELMSRLGVCLARGGGGSVRACLTMLGASCIEGNEAEGWFKTGPHTSLPDPSSLLRAGVLYPMTSSTQLYRVHASLKHLQYNVSLASARGASEAISNLMPLLPAQYQFAIPPIPVADSQSVPTSCIVTPRASYVPKSRYDLGYWEYFNQTRLMGVWRESPSVGITGDVREEARMLLSKAILLATQLHPGGDKLAFDRVENGYRRVDASRGSEYVFDLVFTGGVASAARNAPIRKRVSLLRPYHEDSVPVATSESSSAVNLILPLSGFTERLERFLACYGEVQRAGSGGVSLTVVLYESPDSHIARRVLKQHAERNPSSSVSVVDGVGEFARGAGLHLASERFPGDQILFFVDVDLSVSAQAIHRCRLNAVRGQRVYFPVFFKLYNASFVGRNFRGETRYLVARHNGHWAHYSYGAVCLYADDYRRAGGFELGARGWGNEDVDFLERTLKVGLEPFRAPDPDLIHNWHPKVCDRRAVRDDRTYEDCLRSRGENLADRIELATYVLALETGAVS